MSTVTLQMDEQKMGELTEATRQRGLAIEELFQLLADDFLARKDSFETAANYVLKKNAELHRRLAQ